MDDFIDLYLNIIHVTATMIFVVISLRNVQVPRTIMNRYIESCRNWEISRENEILREKHSSQWLFPFVVGDETIYFRSFPFSPIFLHAIFLFFILSHAISLFLHLFPSHFCKLFPQTLRILPFAACSHTYIVGTCKGFEWVAK